MKTGTLLAYHPQKWNPHEKTWIGIILEYHPEISPNISWIKILWEDGKLDEIHCGYKGFEKNWKIIS